MIVIAGRAKSGKTSALVAACSADPDGVFVRASDDTQAGLLYRWPTLRLLLNYTPKMRLYIDEPINIESWALYVERIAAITVRIIEEQVQP